MVRTWLISIVFYSDMLCIQIVREKMANQWDEDIIRNRNAKRLGKFSNEFHDFDSLDSFLEQLESSC